MRGEAMEEQYVVMNAKGDVGLFTYTQAEAFRKAAGWDIASPEFAPHKVYRKVLEEVPQPEPVPEDAPTELWLWRWRDGATDCSSAKGFAFKTAEYQDSPLWRIPLPRDGWEQVQ